MNIVIPHANYPPPSGDEQSASPGVALTIALDFFSPVRLQRRLPAAELIAMPKMPIDEDRDAERRKDDVGTAGQIVSMNTKPQAVAMKRRSQQQLGPREVQQMQPLFEKNPWLIDNAWTEVNGQSTYTKLLREHCKEPKNLEEKTAAWISLASLPAAS